MPSSTERPTTRSRGSLHPRNPLADLFHLLKSTERGKHVGPFSYYHLSLVERVPSVAARLISICNGLKGDQFTFNVVKLDARYRVSFLSYESFTAPFPALLAARVCDLRRNSVREIDYAGRRNPPILHRKELLLPHDNPIAVASIRITEHLEELGAFADTRRIGTREGWCQHLAALGIDPAELPSQ